MLETWVLSLAWDDPTCCGTTKPVQSQLLNLRSATQDRQLPSPHAATAEAGAPEGPCSATREAAAVRSLCPATRE